MEATTKIRKHSLGGSFGRTLFQSSTNLLNTCKGPVKDNISSESPKLRKIKTGKLKW